MTNEFSVCEPVPDGRDEPAVVDVVQHDVAGGLLAPWGENID